MQTVDTLKKRIKYLERELSNKDCNRSQITSQIPSNIIPNRRRINNMKLYFKGLELEATYTPGEQGTKDKYGIKISPNISAELDIDDVKIIGKSILIEFLHDKHYQDLCDQANGIVYCEKKEADAEKWRAKELEMGVRT